MRPVIIVAMIMSAGVTLAQSPPIKMGLWEKDIINTGGPAAGKMTAKSCVDAAEWKNMMDTAQMSHEGCTTNKTKTADGYTFDTTCTLTGGGSMVIKGFSSIKDSEHIVSESHSTMTIGGQKQQIDVSSNSHFVSADCGAIKPGQPEMKSEQQ